MSGKRQAGMTKTTIAGGVLAILLVVLLLFAGFYRRPERSLDQREEPAAQPIPANALSTAESATESYQGFIFGRVTAYDGVIYEGRLRFGRDEEAFWGDYFNGFKEENPWAPDVPPEKLRERRPFEVFGIQLFQREQQINLSRPFMMRFGDIARIEPSDSDLRVILKSGTTFHLYLPAADDFADGVRVWDTKLGVMDLGEGQIRGIEFLPTGRIALLPDRLHGTVHTRGGDFTGFVQWDWKKGVGSDELEGQTRDGETRFRFDRVRSIVRDSSDGSLVTLLDGKEVALSGSRDVSSENRGIYVDDRRYGRVLIPWDAFERADFTPSSGSGPAYADFPKGNLLTGEVTTRDGRHFAGRLVYDLDESETTETLDAPSRGINYTIFLGMIASIVLPDADAADERGSGRATVTLHSGEALQLELAGDLGTGNGGILIYGAGGSKLPDYLRWTDIKQVRLDRPTAMYPPLETH